jgi:serine/threonine protein kinase
LLDGKSFLDSVVGVPRHPHTPGRSVAIKVSSREFNDRFEREARAISTLNHPDICTLQDIGPNYL